MRNPKMPTKMASHPRRRQISLILLSILIFTSAVTSSEVQKDLPSNHKESNVSPTSSALRMEARGDDDGLDLTPIEAKSKTSSLIFADHDTKPNKPQILGSTSKVAVVYSQRIPLEADKPSRSKKLSTEERIIRKPLDTAEKTKSKKPTDERNWRVVKTSSRDSYLDALDHSHTSKDPREGVVRVDAKPKNSKLIRREYREGPVYRPGSDQYGHSNKEQNLDYGEHAAASDNFARISYGGPTPEPFFPTPSDTYSLPAQPSVNFNEHQGSYGAPPQESYGPPQTSYGAPSSSHGSLSSSYGSPSSSYGSPSSSYGSPSSSYGSLSSSYGSPSSSYGPPQNAYGPPSNGYPGAGGPQQAYGPPYPVYGAPYAIQDYSQHIPSLASIGFSWPFALKLNAFTIAKILLKLVIFKMIVKFIALICLLLFIPKLEIIKKGDKENGDEDEGRRLLSSDSALERLNVLTALVTSSIEKYEKETGKPITDGECTSFGCRMRKFVTYDQSWNDYVRLFKSYVVDETNRDDDKGTLTNHVNS